MRPFAAPSRLLVALLALFAAIPGARPAAAVEGPAAAGPIGGTDIRSGMLPPPGVYVGAATFVGKANDIVDGNGRTLPFLDDAHLDKQVGAAFLFYVPKMDVFGGSIGIGGMLVGGNQCGHLFPGQRDRCTTNFGDPYVELDWSKSWAKPRASQYPGAYPIMEGLSVLVGFGVVIPVGQYDASDPLEQSLSSGANTWDFAPSAAFTYTTAPFLAEGTEFSARLFWNNYLENTETHYRMGDIVNLDFAITEHIGRFQVGVTGFYAWQPEDDKQFGVALPPDGRRGELLQLGGIVNYDMPEHKASMKIKVLKGVEVENTIDYWAVVMGLTKGF